MPALAPSPLTARWTQPDPIDQPADLRQANRYSYVGGDPINNIDQTGAILFTPKNILKGAKGIVKGVAKNASPSTGGDTNRFSDDVGDAINCLNPIGSETGEVGGTDDAG
jgi:hypothetical protein